MKRFVFLIALCAVISHCTAQKQSVPSWVKDAVFYQIFPERFANGDTTNDPPNIQPWGGVPASQNYFGGDLKGIIDHLDYLQRLGVNALYLTPIFESPTNHKYHTTDYLKIDHNFGDETTFKRLLNECHARKMHIIIDGVFNHTGVNFFAFQDVKKNEKNSKYLSWYNVYGFPIASPAKPNYEGWWGLGDLPRLMTNNPEVRKYLFDVTTYWTTMGLDGWRLDAAKEVSHDFWKDWRKLVKSENPDAYIVGEIWDDASDWLKGDEFDAAMNYRFRGTCVGFFALENQKASQLDSVLHVQRLQYPDEINYALQNLIGSHDTERFLTLSGGDLRKLKLAALFQMTYIGVPMVYYGDEVGMEGGKDPGCRKTMEWDSTKWNEDLFHWYQTIIAIRNEHSALRNGSYKTVLVDDTNKVFGFFRENTEEGVLVIINNGSDTLSMNGKVPTLSGERWFNTFTDREQRNAVALDMVTVPARSGIILVAPRYR
jgi:cyclomaltodextrinase